MHLRVALALALCAAASALSMGVRVPSTCAPQQRAAARLQSPGVDSEPLVENVALAPFSDVELAEQSAKLDALAKKWKKRQIAQSDGDLQQLGWCLNAEQINGRLAMFFLLTGLITEYYTGESMPEQVYTLLQTLSLVE